MIYFLEKELMRTTTTTTTKWRSRGNNKRKKWGSWNRRIQSITDPIHHLLERWYRRRDEEEMASNNAQ